MIPETKQRPITLRPVPKAPDIILSLHSLELPIPKWHWILWVADAAGSRGEVQQGYKMHVEHRSRRGWTYECVPFRLATSTSIATAAIIGQLKGRTVDDLNAVHLISAITMGKRTQVA